MAQSPQPPPQKSLEKERHVLSHVVVPCFFLTAKDMGNSRGGRPLFRCRPVKGRRRREEVYANEGGGTSGGGGSAEFQQICYIAFLPETI